jgi:hypothetical protein
MKADDNALNYFTSLTFVHTGTKKMLPQSFLSVAYGILGFGHNQWSPQIFVRDPELQNGPTSYISKGSEGPWVSPKASLINEINFE